MGFTGSVGVEMAVESLVDVVWFCSSRTRSVVILGSIRTGGKGSTVDDLLLTNSLLSSLVMGPVLLVEVDDSEPFLGSNGLVKGSILLLLLFKLMLRLRLRLVATGGTLGKRGGSTDFPPIGLMTDDSMVVVVVVEERLFIKDECDWNALTEEEEEEVGGGGAGFITDDAEGGGTEVRGSGRSTLPASKAARSTSIVVWKSCGGSMSGFHTES